MKTSLFLVAFTLLSASAVAITPNSVESELARLIQTNANQKRIEMIHSPLLNAVARAKALDLAKRNYFNHVDPDGFGPNRVAQLVGHSLPEFYGSERGTNYIESLGGGATSAAQQFSAWLGSAGHRTHVLGTDAFYAEQTHYGVGYVDVAGSQYSRYYVFISTPPPKAGEKSGEYAEWLLQQFLPKTLEGTNDLTDHDADGIPRLQEFILGFEPRSPNILPSPTLSPDSKRLEWRLPLRAAIGSITVQVERSADLKAWTTEGVSAEPGGLFSIPIDRSIGGMRLAAEH